MDLTIGHVLVRLLLGVLIGASIGLTGVGGGVLVVPALTIVLGLPPSSAVGTANLYSFLTKLYAAFRHYRLRTIDFRVSWWFLLGAVPSDLLLSWLITRSVRAVHAAGRSGVGFQAGLSKLIGAVIVLSFVAMAVHLKRKREGRVEAGAGLLGSRPRSRAAATAAIGVVIGALLGSTSVGGAILVIPLFLMVLNLPPSRTVGTSIFTTVALTLAASLVYGRSGELDVTTALCMAAGSLAGVHWGVKAAARANERVLQGAIMSMMLLAAFLMFARAYR